MRTPTCATRALPATARAARSDHPTQLEVRGVEAVKAEWASAKEALVVCGHDQLAFCPEVGCRHSVFPGESVPLKPLKGLASTYQHYTSAHGGASGKPFVCDTCDGRFVSAPRLKTHAKACGGGANCSVVCGCGNTFASRKLFNNHVARMKKCVRGAYATRDECSGKGQTCLPAQPCCSVLLCSLAHARARARTHEARAAEALLRNRLLAAGAQPHAEVHADTISASGWLGWLAVALGHALLHQRHAGARAADARPFSSLLRLQARPRRSTADKRARRQRAEQPREQILRRALRRRRRRRRRRASRAQQQPRALRRARARAHRHQPPHKHPNLAQPTRLSNNTHNDTKPPLPSHVSACTAAQQRAHAHAAQTHHHALLCVHVAESSVPVVRPKQVGDIK
jgi:hypothetical protein